MSLLYVGVVIYFGSDHWVKDEVRFYGYALHILEGKYAMESDTFLWNGPAWPVIITPLVSLGYEKLGIRMLNIPLMLLALIYFERSLSLLKISNVLKLMAILLLSLYPSILLFSMPTFMSEVFCLCLINMLCFYLLKFSIETRFMDFLKVAGIGAVLILTKVVFFYVYLILFVILCLLQFYNQSFKHYSKIAGFTLILIVPYLCYTFFKTDTFPYVANSGGMSLFWMTVEGKEHKGEWHPFPGDWNPFPRSSNQKWSIDNSNAQKQWYLEQTGVIENWSQLPPVEANDFLIAQSIENIFHSPEIFLRNIFSNIKRYYFDVPRNRKSGIHWLYYCNLLHIAAFMICFLLLSKCQPKIKFIILLYLIYTFLSFVLSSYERFSQILVGVTLLMLCLFIEPKMFKAQQAGLRIFRREKMNYKN